MQPGGSRSGPIDRLDGDLLKGDVWNVLHSLSSVLNSNPAQLTLSIEIKQCVFVEVARLCDLRCSKLDVEGVS